MHVDARVRITSTVEHRTVFRNRNVEESQTVSSSRCHSWPISVTLDRSAENSFDRLCAVAIHCLMNCIRGTLLLPASFTHHYLLHHHNNSLQPSFPLHSSQSSPSPPWLARCFRFRPPWRRGYPLPPLNDPWRCYPHAPGRCHPRRASDNAV